MRSGHRLSSPGVHVYLIREIAHIGYGEKDAEAKGIAVQSFTVDHESVAPSKRYYERF